MKRIKNKLVVKSKLKTRIVFKFVKILFISMMCLVQLGDGFAYSKKIDSLIKERIVTNINSSDVDSFILKQCPKESELSDILEGYTRLNDLDNVTKIFVPKDYLKNLPFVIYTDLKLNNVSVCILSFMNQKDVEAIVFGGEHRNQIDKRILTDSSYLKVDTKISYKIKDYQISIYHGSSALNQAQLIDKVLSSLDQRYKKISSNSTQETTKNGYRSMWIRSEDKNRDSSLFIDIYDSNTNIGEMNLYEITTR